MTSDGSETQATVQDKLSDLSLGDDNVASDLVDHSEQDLQAVEDGPGERSDEAGKGIEQNVGEEKSTDAAEETFYPATASFEETQRTTNVSESQPTREVLASNVDHAAETGVSQFHDAVQSVKDSYSAQNPTTESVSTVDTQTVPGTDQTRDIPTEVVHENADTTGPSFLQAMTGTIAQTVVSVKDALVGKSSKPRAGEKGSPPVNEISSAKESAVGAEDFVGDLTRSYPPHIEQRSVELKDSTQDSTNDAQ